MDIRELLAELQSALQPHRRLDTQIARAVGYQKVASLEPSQSGKLVWFGPDGARLDPPFFTADLDAAQELADMLAPGIPTAVRWGKQPSAALFDMANSVQAPTAAMALCIAALKVAKTTEDGRILYKFPPSKMLR